MAPRDYICKFCKKGFSAEKTLSSHMCVKKKRYADKDSITSRLGLRVFQMFYEMTTNSKKPKTMSDFIESKYYIQFVKFGRYLIDLDPIDSDDFITFIIKNGVKLKDWTAAYVYEIYLEELMKKEPMFRAVERTLITMETWGNDNNESYATFFKNANINEVVYLIRSGKISPWVLYLAPSADDFFDRINEEQMELIQQIIDPAKWQVIFMSKQDDTEQVRETLEEAML